MKNKDPVNESVVELFKKSNEILICTIYEDFVAVSDATGNAMRYVYICVVVVVFNVMFRSE